MKYLLTIFMIFFIGCSDEPPKPKDKMCIDKNLRKIYFDDCLSKVPQGPQSTVNNDWDEVLEECDDISKSQAKKLVTIDKCHWNDNDGWYIDSLKGK